MMLNYDPLWIIRGKLAFKKVSLSPPLERKLTLQQNRENQTHVSTGPSLISLFWVGGGGLPSSFLLSPSHEPFIYHLWGCMAPAADSVEVSLSRTLQPSSLDTLHASVSGCVCEWRRAHLHTAHCISFASLICALSAKLFIEHVASLHVSLRSVKPCRKDVLRLLR